DGIVQKAAPEHDAGDERARERQEDHPADGIAHHHVPRAGEHVENARHGLAALVVGLHRVLLADALGRVHAGAADEDVHALRAELLAGAGVRIAPLAHFAAAALAAPARLEAVP